MKTTRSHAEIAAFTLAELLIAISITVLIVALLARIFAAAASEWRSSDQRIDVFREARAALQIMQRDLSRAVVRSDPRMLKLDNPGPSGNYAQEAYVIAPIPNGGKSDLCAVGYYLNWNGTTKTFSLKRLFKDSNATTAGLQGAALNLTGLFTKDPSTDEDLASCVWDLEFRPGELADPIPPGMGSPAEWRWLEIRFKAMSPAAARKIGNAPVDEATWAEQPPGLSATYKNLILPNEQQFVTRVWLNQNQ